MAAAVRQGLPVLYAGGHGTGPWGDKVRAALAAEDISLLRPADPDADTGFDVALVETDGERTFVTQLGAESLREPGAWDLVRQLRTAGTTILLTTHDMAEAQALADRVVLLSNGAVVAEGPPASLGGSDASRARITFTLPPGVTLADLSVPGTSKEGSVVIETAQPTADLHRLSSWAMLNSRVDLPEPEGAEMMNRMPAKVLS